MMGNLLPEAKSSEANDALREVYVSRNNSVSKEQVPLLHSFRTSRKNSDHPHSLMGDQRSFSVGQLGFTSTNPPQESPFLRTDSETTERDSGFSTLPRSITLASVSNWSGDSPRFLRLPKR
ncbi:leucine-rich repeats and immunoglobulin-like domains protein 3 [Caerostris extrusa]|uniref:Leucine-rich repeats and immunoglobulin-like domains protein 3 n=1 Tax=Caerostris extrusa TaxID=172846 RepID=A0AAV4R6P3_CAEEX|nr:leucine-rich repeats and immunoglobulin-like domains protein 3 [Caerostris extrusa]